MRAARQTSLQRETDAGVTAAEYSYIAIHGTGTPLGDPIEMGALGQALGKGSSSSAGSTRLVHIGSVKSCYGHSEGAAGLTGTLLAVKALQQQVRKPNP